MVYFITHTEPAPGYLQKGNLARFYVRQFNPETLEGKSLYFDLPFDLIVPSFEVPKETTDAVLKGLAHAHPDIGFEVKSYNTVKDVLWASMNDKSRKEELPKSKPCRFAAKKSSYSKLLRWFFPPFLAVDVDRNGQLVLPNLEKILEQKDLSFVDWTILLKEKRCALDIETTGWMYEGDLEKITAAVLNFGSGVKNIVSVFDAARVSRFRDYSLFCVQDTDSIIEFVEKSMVEEDPLFVYFFNGSFDKEKLRELGTEEFRPGTDFTRPVFKSVQALKNMIMKGRWDIEEYGYVFLYRSLYKNNKLETQANHPKTLDHVTLELKTKKAIAGDGETAMELLTYIADDGDITFDFGEKLLPLILPKAHFTKREPSSICTTSGINIMNEFWGKKYFFMKHTFWDRYHYGKPEHLGFDAEKKKDEVLNLRKKFSEIRVNKKGEEYEKYIAPSGFHENLHLFYPGLFVLAAYDMIRKTTDNLPYGETPDEHLNYFQTLLGYVSHALNTYYEIKEQSPENCPTIFPDEVKIGERKVKVGVLANELKQLYSSDLREYPSSINIYKIDARLTSIVPQMFEAIEKAGLVTFSKKFLYVLNPEPLLRQFNEKGEFVSNGFGFVYGSGPAIYSGDGSVNKIASLVNGKLIFQGFGLRGGIITGFDKEVMEGAIFSKLHGISGKLMDDLIEKHYSQIEGAEKSKLVFNHVEERANKEKGMEGKKYPAGVLEDGLIVPKAEFLESQKKPDFGWYMNNFERRFDSILRVIRA